MSAVRDDNFVVEHGWMVNRLQLKGNDLRVYAIIYGFSQTGGQEFTGNLQYLADWVNGTKQGVQKNLKVLLDRGLIKKREYFTNGVKQCAYRATELPPIQQSCTGCATELHGGMQQSCTGYATELHGGMQQSCTNNIGDNIPDNIPDKKEIGGQAPTPPPEKKSTKKAKADTEAILARYTTDPATLELLREWLKVRKAKRAPQTEKALTLNLDKLDALAQESGLAVPAYLEAVIARGWAAFYAIKDARPVGGGFQRPQPERSRIKSEADYAAGLQGWG